MSREVARQVLEIESQAIRDLIGRLDGEFDRALDLLAACRGRLVTTGMGKSGIVCRKIAATFASTGTPALYMHPAEAIHGDLGMLAAGDIALALSNSGETEEILRLLGTLRRMGIPLISLVGDLKSTLARQSDVVFDVSVDREACSIGLAPTASTTAALAWGDALAVALSHRKGFRIEDFARLHPGGRLGKRLALVEEVMHQGDQVPRVSLETPMEQVIYEMSRKGMGVTTVVDGSGGLAGVISDGDLRRLLQTAREGLLSRCASECMSGSPVTIGPTALAVEALNKMEQRRITSLVVVDAEVQVLGLVHLHDLWGTEMF